MTSNANLARDSLTSLMHAEPGSFEGPGRGVRLTPEGQLLAHRAAEIVGRVDAAADELAAHIGLQAGRVRLAANASALSTIVPTAVATLARTPGNRAEPDRAAPGRGAPAVAPRRDRHRPRL